MRPPRGLTGHMHMAPSPSILLPALPTDDLVDRLQQAADDRRFSGVDPHDDEALLREAAERLSRTKTNRRTVLLGGM